MFCVQNRVYCNDCNKSYTDANYANHSGSQGQVLNVRRDYYKSS